MIKPITPQHFYINIIYNAASAVAIVLLLFSVFNKQRKPMMTLVWWVCVYTAFRQGIRCFDFEETYVEFKHKGEWHLLVLMEVVCTKTTIIVCVNCFEQTRFKVFVCGLLIVFTIVTFYAGSYGR